MKIGIFEISPGAMLAPMAGVTDIVFRNICLKYGAAASCTEMVSVQGLFYQPKKSLELMAPDNSCPRIVQIFGQHANQMADMAKKYCTDYDIIDINMGCPAQKIVKGGAGSALMKDTQKAKDIIKAVADATKKPVTCKIRSGWDENNINAIEFAGEMERAGASMIALHARTREQYYSGQADWGLIKKLKNALKIPLVGNGDIKEPQDAKKMMDYTNCDGVMVGRAAQGNPYLFSQIKTYLTNGEKAEEPDLKTRMSDAMAHAKGLSEHFGEKNAVRMMRKHLAWYIKGEKNAAMLRNQAVRVSSLEQISDFLDMVIEHSEDMT